MLLIERWQRVQHKIEICPDTQCHVWTGAKNRSGHGTIMVQRQRLFVHRVAYIVRNGRIWDNHDIHHRCHNPSCVNPDHLVCLTRSAHMRLHRKPRPDRHPPALCKKGHKGHYTKNAQGSWICKICSRESDKRYYERRREIEYKERLEAKREKYHLAINDPERIRKYHEYIAKKEARRQKRGNTTI